MDISELLGKTLTAVIGAERESEQIEFHCTDGTKYVLLHHQDCCEYVRVEDVVGDISDLIGNLVLEAEKQFGGQDNGTWTFYKLGTIKGHVTLRWLGESNGYYSESVDFEQL